MQIIYTIVKKKDLREIIKKETGLSLYSFALACGKSYSYLYAVDKETITISAEKWEQLKLQIEAVRKLNK